MQSHKYNIMAKEFVSLFSMWRLCKYKYGYKRTPPHANIIISFFAQTYCNVHWAMLIISSDRESTNSLNSEAAISSYNSDTCNRRNMKKSFCFSLEICWISYEIKPASGRSFLPLCHVFMMSWLHDPERNHCCYYFCPAEVLNRACSAVRNPLL